MYNIDDIVVYRRDVCRVVGKQKSSFTGEMCYVLVPYGAVDNSVTMQVPVSNKGGHLRDVVSKERIDELCRSASCMETLESGYYMRNCFGKYYDTTIPFAEFLKQTAGVVYR